MLKHHKIAGLRLANSLAARAALIASFVACLSLLQPVTESFAAAANPSPAAATAQGGSAEKLMSSVEQDRLVSEKARQGIFAEVEGVKIDLEDFLHVYRSGIRETFYHGRVKSDEVETFRRKIVNQLITDELLAQEAQRRGLRITDETVSRKVDAFVEINKKAKNWDKVKTHLIPALKRIYQREELVKLLRADVEEMDKPSSGSILEYYDKNKDKFTAPERWHVALILLSVDPSSPANVWDDAFELASRLVERARDGESFEEFARIHSADPTAANGGDMGYIHIGMLSKPAQEMLNIMKVGDISEPVMLLKGVAVFRLDGVEAPRLNKFEKVKERAGDLLQRERKSETWESLRKSIWKGKKITLADEFARYIQPPK